MVAPAQATNKRTKHSYPPEKVAEALSVLDSHGGNVYRAAKELRMPYHTLREWARNKRRITPEVLEIQRIKAGTLAEKFEQIAHRAADYLSDSGVLALASPLDLAKIGGIAVDKSQLLNGQPTSISGTVMSEDERRLRIAELLAKLRDREAAPQPAPA